MTNRKPICMHSLKDLVLKGVSQNADVNVSAPPQTRQVFFVLQESSFCSNHSDMYMCVFWLNTSVSKNRIN